MSEPRKDRQGLLWLWLSDQKGRFLEGVWIMRLPSSGVAEAHDRVLQNAVKMVWTSGACIFRSAKKKHQQKVKSAKFLHFSLSCSLSHSSFSLVTFTLLALSFATSASCRSRRCPAQGRAPQRHGLRLHLGSCSRALRAPSRGVGFSSASVVVVVSGRSSAIASLEALVGESVHVILQLLVNFHHIYRGGRVVQRTRHEATRRRERRRSRRDTSAFHTAAAGALAPTSSRRRRCSSATSAVVVAVEGARRRGRHRPPQSRERGHALQLLLLLLSFGGQAPVDGIARGAGTGRSAAAATAHTGSGSVHAVATGAAAGAPAPAIVRTAAEVAAAAPAGRASRRVSRPRIDSRSSRCVVAAAATKRVVYASRNDSERRRRRSGCGGYTRTIGRHATAGS